MAQPLQLAALLSFLGKGNTPMAQTQAPSLMALPVNNQPQADSLMSSAFGDIIGNQGEQQMGAFQPGESPQMMGASGMMQGANPQQAQQLEAIKQMGVSESPMLQKQALGMMTQYQNDANRPVGSNMPANVQEWQYYSQLSEDQKTEYDKMKRGESVYKQEIAAFKQEQAEKLAEINEIGRKDKAKKTIVQQNTLSDAIDTFMKNDDYVDTVTGYTGLMPTITPSGVDAVAQFNNIKNNLTLENLDKMSGVLSETDIKILSNAASSLQEGMTKPAMQREMNKIKKILGNKSQDVIDNIFGGVSPVESQAGGNTSPSGITYTVK